jgi:hypothetical protein
MYIWGIDINSMIIDEMLNTNLWGMPLASAART